MTTDTPANTIAGTLTLTLTLGSFVPAPGDKLITIENFARSGSVISGTFASLPENAVFKQRGATFRINYQSGTDGDNDDVMLTGIIGATYALQESTDLINWTTIATNVAAQTTGA